jgi:arylsulfatase A-like enzyme
MAEQKNVLFILADQFRADCLGIDGHPVVQTPNLDALAREGTRFSKAFVQTSPCGPSRMSIFTSRYLCSTRAVDNQTPFAEAQENLAFYIREGGYKPALMGYNDYAVDPRILPPDDPRTYTPNYDNFLPGFDVALDHEYDSQEYFQMLREKGYPEELLSHEAIHKPNVPTEGPGDHLPIRYPAHYTAEDSEGRFITNVAIDHIVDRKAEGWMLSLNYIKPHPPRICATPYNEMYDPEKMPSPNRLETDLQSDHPYLKHVHRKPELIPDLDLTETRANYYGMITELDACLGILFQALKDSGQWDNTLIVFSSDHGEYLGDHYLTGKGGFYDETMRVPLIIRDPSAEADHTRGSKLESFVESIDIAPTILEVLDLPIPGRFQGTSLLGQVRGSSNALLRSEIHYEKDFRNAGTGSHPHQCLLWVIRDDNYKYVQFADETIPPLLYDLASDPGEHTNVADDPNQRDTILAYCQKLLRWRMTNEDQRMEDWAFQYR